MFIVLYIKLKHKLLMNSISIFDSIINIEGSEPEYWLSLLNELKNNKQK